jgi:hypothetical protein
MDIINILDASEKAIATLMLEVNRLTIELEKYEQVLEHNVKLIDDLFAERKEVIRLEAEIEALKKELALQKLSDIGQMIEDKESAIYATGYWKGIEYKKMRELTDGEILNIYLEQTNGNKDLDILEFARAILKKASEK